ncbi:MAG TPA: molybdopterin-synthase adenylyltransferase MoeB [Caldilineae bacterium]|nr:molybdopterin-synthase adenylyltransferase MoeB [Caldilineae bacterium]
MSERTRAFLKTPEWLKEHITDPSIRVIDVRPTLEQLESGYPWGHIPGAVHLDARELFTMVDGIPGKLVPQTTGEAVLGRLGLSREDRVVVYDDSGGPLAAQIAWLLDYWGQAEVLLLDGGWQAWLASGGEVSTDQPQITPRDYQAQPDESKIATIEWIEAHLGHPDVILVDARTPQEYERGHLPDAILFPWEMCVSTGTVQRYLDERTLRHRFVEAGITPDKEIAVYCETGARSAHVYWALRLAGYLKVRNYEGSWAEWSRRHKVFAEERAETAEQPAAGPCGLSAVPEAAAPSTVSPLSSERLTRDQLLAQARAQVPELDVYEVKRRLDEGEPLTLIDIREREEWVQGHIPGAKFIPRGFLELRIEEVQPDRDAPIVVYCAGGVRSLLGARDLKIMGYRNVYSMAGGFTRWKNAGLPFVVPRVLSDEQRTRYSRHIIIPEIGEEGQIKLLESKALIIGAGGLGSPAAYYLAAAGVGTIGIVDFDEVDLSNLQRQILHGHSDIGRPKVESAMDTLREINPDVEVIPHRVRLDSSNALDIIKAYDIVLNGSDNFPTRYLVNDACVLLGKPLVDASIFIFEGQVTVYDPQRGGPCYRCLYPDPPPPGEVPSCAEAGVLGVLPGIVGSIQAVEAIKYLLGIGEPLVGRLLMFDALDMTFRMLRVQRDKDCPVCGEHPTVTELIDYEQFCGLPPRRSMAEGNGRGDAVTTVHAENP